MLFSNQKGESYGAGRKSDDEKVNDVKAKFNSFLRVLNDEVKVVVLAAVGDSHFRKPHTAMWEWFEKKVALKSNIDRSKSVFVGSA